MNLNALGQTFFALLHGVPVTLQLVSLALLIGFGIGVVIAASRMSHIPGLWHAAYLFVYVIRGTPLLVQIFLIYYGLGQVDAVRTSLFWPVLRDEFWCAIIALAINSGAYTSEVIRGGIESVDRGQVEAAIAYGMSRWKRIRHIVVPQAVRQLIPAYGNEFIIMVKASALASTITLMEITGIARNLASKTYTPIETFAAAGVIYLAINILIAQSLRSAERRLDDVGR